MLVLMEKNLMHLLKPPSSHKGNYLATLDLILKNIFLDLKIYELQIYPRFCSASVLKDLPKILFSFIVEDLSGLKNPRFSC
jgi:hypothetical protein